MVSLFSTALNQVYKDIIMRLSPLLKFAILFTVASSMSGLTQAANTYCIDPDMDAILATAAGCDSSTNLFSDIASFDSYGFTLGGGDKVLFKRGAVYREQLEVPASGTEGNSIIYDAYGDTALPNPKIVRTDLYDNWWLDGLIHNTSLETYLTTGDSSKDDFISWSERIIGCALTADSTTKRSGNTSMKMVCDPAPTGDLAMATVNVGSLKPGTNYTLTAYAMSLDSIPNMILWLRYYLPNGSIKYMGPDGTWVDEDTRYSWATGSTPGVWEEKTLNLPPTENDGGRFVIAFYSRGTNATWLDDVSLTETGVVSNEKVWVGTMPGVNQTYGAMVNSQRLPVVQASPGSNTPEFVDYYNYVESVRLRNSSTYNASNLRENRFYKQSKGATAYVYPYFYIRNDSGNPGPMEVATRQYAILISNKSYISINNIDVEGPGVRFLRDKDDGDRGGALIRVASSSHQVDVNNLEVQFSHQIGISADGNTTQIHYNNINVHDNGSTGIYNNSTDGIIKGSLAHHNGNALYDSGDRGGIGTQGTNMEISGNSVYHNGPDGGADNPVGYSEKPDADFEISAFSAPYTTIEKNHVYDCIQGCIQLAQGSSNSEVRYNIIDGFGTIMDPNAANTYGKWSAIRIGGNLESTGSANVNIFNNVITGGRVTHPNRHAAIMFACGDNSGAEIRNNIITDNTSWHVFVTNSSSQCAYTDINLNNNDNLLFSNNLYEEYNSNYTWYGWVLPGAQTTDISEWRDLSSISEQVGAPLFEDLVGNDFHISSASSPVVDKGIYVNLDYDYEGNAIVGLPDIGAYEHQDPDNDGFNAAEDCNNQDASIYPGATEIISDGIDQDCNGFDLTIEIVKAEYKSGRKRLKVRATSSLNETADLQLDGYGTMNWKSNRGQWRKTIKNLSQAPATVTVSGPEGSVTVAVTVK